MGINPRTKGQTGEREVALLLNGIIMLAMRELGFPEEKVIAAATTVQRNQNQSAVGGADLTNTFGLAIEIKRQEQLSVETWWRQCEAAAARNNERPVLLYRQNHGSWKCRMHVLLAVGDAYIWTVGEISYLDFQTFFKQHVILRLRQGEAVRI